MSEEIEAVKPKRTIEVDIEIGQESLECIIEMAGYGIAYWASSAEHDNEAKTYKVVENNEGDYEEHVVTYDQIVEAFWKIADAGSDAKAVGSMVRGYAVKAIVDGLSEGDGDIDAGHVDGDLADSIIQVAIWNEVIFG